MAIGSDRALFAIQDGFCNVCNEPLTTKKRGGEDYYYCKQCKRYVMKVGVNHFTASEVAKEKAEVNLYHNQCNQCGNNFSTNWANTLYCSKECSNAANKERQESEVKRCANCGKEFSGNSSNAKYCGYECRRANKKNNNEGLNRLFNK